MTEHKDQSAFRDAQRLEIIEYTDPFCSWAWGTEPKLRRLRLALGADVSWRQVIGILYDGSAGASEDRAAEIEAQYERWADVIPHTGAPIPTALEWPVSSSWPASRAIKAAELQEPGLGGLVLRRLRESLFLFGRPGDDAGTIGEALDGVPGLDVETLLDDLDDDLVKTAADSDWEETRNPLEAVIGLTEPAPHHGAAAPDRDRLRYRFPTLVIRGPQGTTVVPGWRDYDTYVDAVSRVAPDATISDGRLPTADDALDLFETLTEVDLAALTVTSSAPARAVSLQTRNGSVWVRHKRPLANSGLTAVQPLEDFRV
jgi:predicted DsbA family dithiol-disulfide isomerase